MQMDNSRSKKLDAAFELACDELKLALSGKHTITDRTKVASTVIGGYSRIYSTEVHLFGLEVMMGKQDGKKLIK